MDRTGWGGASPPRRGGRLRGQWGVVLRDSAPVLFGCSFARPFPRLLLAGGGTRGRSLATLSALAALHAPRLAVIRTRAGRTLRDRLRGAHHRGNVAPWRRAAASILHRMATLVVMFGCWASVTWCDQARAGAHRLPRSHPRPASERCRRAAAERQLQHCSQLPTLRFRATDHSHLPTGHWPPPVRDPANTHRLYPDGCTGRCRRLPRTPRHAASRAPVPTARRRSSLYRHTRGR